MPRKKSLAVAVTKADVVDRAEFEGPFGEEAEVFTTNPSTDLRAVLLTKGDGPQPKSLTFDHPVRVGSEHNVASGVRYVAMGPHCRVLLDSLGVRVWHFWAERRERPDVIREVFTPWANVIEVEW